MIGAWLYSLIVYCSELPGNFLENCRLTDDFLTGALSPFEGVTGGLFVPIFWGVIIFAVYLRYHAAVLSLLAGLPVLLGGIVAFPDGTGLVLPILIASVIGIALYFIVYRSPGPVVDPRN